MRADADRETLRILLGARHDLNTAKTAQINRLPALLLTGDDTDRNFARNTLPDTALSSPARRRLPAGSSRENTVRRTEIRRLALAIGEAEQILRTNQAQIAEIVADFAPGLTSYHGIGPITAAQAVVSFSHKGRCRNEAAFACRAGTHPIPASSGRTVRHRLNRGGDRTLNRAIHTLALTRMRSCPKTRAYLPRRTAEGKTPREIRRFLKQYIARQFYRHLTNTIADSSQHP